MLERVKSFKDVVVLNDEAHHVHDEDLAWSQSLLAIHRALPTGLSIWLDFSATPKDQNGMYFPWTVCDDPTAQAVEDRIVKVPLIVTKENDPKRPSQDPDRITKETIAEKYGYWIQAAVQRWKEHWSVYRKLGTKPVLFDFERRFAQFLDNACDVLRFASLGSTEQGESWTQFRVDYRKPSGAIGFYQPGWAVVQCAGRDEINWIIETKGRVREGTTAKDEAIWDWCERISDSTGRSRRFVRVNERQFDSANPTRLADLIL